MIRNLLQISIGTTLLSSCSLVGDAVDISSRRSKELSSNEVLEGAGFQARSPTSGLYPVRNLPFKGAITFRPIEPLLDGMVYFVTPFSSHAPTFQQAISEWNSIPARKGYKVTILEQKRTTYGDFAALEAITQVDQGSGGQIAAILIVGKPGRYFVLHRGDNFYYAKEKSTLIVRCKAGLQKLKTATKIYNG